MDQWLKQHQGIEKGPLNFGALPDMTWANRGGTGVAYLSSTAGSQTYSANSLVSR